MWEWYSAECEKCNLTPNVQGGRRCADSSRSVKRAKQTGATETGQLRIGLNGIARFQKVGAGNTVIVAGMKRNPKTTPFALLFVHDGR
jgi:hypothetical protein